MITRRSAHQLFAIIALVLFSVMASQALSLYNNEKVRDAVNAIPDAIAAEDVLNTSTKKFNNSSVQLRLGSALAKGNNLADSERVLNTLINDSSDADVRIKAQFNLANAYLREALKSGTQASSQSLPMVELAKQRYRDLLAEKPEHWSARYNLARALRMAPEGTDRDGDSGTEPIKRVNVIVPGFEKKDLP